MTPRTIDLERYIGVVQRLNTVKTNGKVAQVIGVVVESIGPQASIGELCYIVTSRTKPPVPAEVVGFRDNRVLLMPLADVEQIANGNEVIGTGTSRSVAVGMDLLGRVLDGLGQPIDNKGPIVTDVQYPVFHSPPHPLQRKQITSPLCFGVKAIDGILTCGKGQRIGIFAGSGVGKSTLLGMIARSSSADVNVIALIGERGREVREFIEKRLGPQGMARSVVVVATSDQPAIQRLQGAMVATTIAEFFRDQGLDVMLMMDSVTRFAWAQREIGLAIGEPPTTRGYTPSVFALMPKLLERSGAGEQGTITGLYTVLVEGDDMNEPVADTVRGILDGHIVLSRQLADRGHYPAIDVLPSVSRLMPDITTSEHRRAATRVREILSTYRQSEDLISIGAYARGSNPKIDDAITNIDGVNAFLTQPASMASSWDDTMQALMRFAPGKELQEVSA
ncbi:MAG TPA: flagellar protein export ATPase FliI [Armatimonadota bacterium]|nr:flagellar protein export ATPase FliI [Armatimonadota bacterium]